MATQACDSCYIRKIRCVQPTATEAFGSPGSQTSTPVCKPCQEIRMQCTYGRPRQRRPRRPKARQSSGASIDATASSEIRDYLQRSSDGGTPSSGIASLADIGSPFSLQEQPLTEMPSFEAPSSAHVPEQSTPKVCDFQLPQIGTRQVCDLMVKDYLDLLYPLVPLVHRPTFKVDVASDKVENDQMFYSLLLSIFAAVVASLPRRFLEYKKAQWFFGFRTPSELVMHLEQALLKLRPYDYFEAPTTQKCIISYFLGIAFASLNFMGRTRNYFGECWLFLKSLSAHNPESYLSLDHIEAQLRKKAFWLCCIFSVHDRLGISHLETRFWNPMPDQVLFDSKDFETLVPLQVDDEYIMPTTIYPQPSPETSLAAGFISLVRIYACMIDFPEEKNECGTHVNTAGSRDPCEGWIRRSHSKYEVLRRMFDRVRYVLDDVAPQLAAWRNESIETATADETPEKSSQLEIIRANINVTRMWVRSLLFERMIALDQDSAPGIFIDERSQWCEREDCCEQLLHLLYNIKLANLEPNGVSLTFKIRQVAVPLLECSFEDHTSISKRARRYIEKFMELLTFLDQYSFQDTQMVVWRDFERRWKQPASEFIENAQV